MIAFNIAIPITFNAFDLLPTFYLQAHSYKHDHSLYFRSYGLSALELYRRAEFSVACPWHPTAILSNMRFPTHYARWLIKISFCFSLNGLPFYNRHYLLSISG
jgi:hypothetical protein